LLYDPQDLPVTLLQEEQPLQFPAGRFIAPGAVQGANFALRRQALEEIRGFDTHLGAGTRFPSEDIDVVGRASAAGWAGAYRPEIVVYHHHGRRTQSEAHRLLKGYDRGRGAYYAKCLLIPALRKGTVWHWLYHMHRQPLQRTAREVAATISYLFRYCLVPHHS
jgi:GT2 family glycosyltransferase